MLKTSASDTDGAVGEERQNRFGEKVSKTSKSKSTKSSSRSGFLTFEAKIAFAQLRQAFIKVLILQHFDPERHIWIETNASRYAIGGILSQLTLETSQ